MKHTERKRRRFFGMTALSLILVFRLAACGGGSSYNQARQSSEEKAAYDAEAYSADYAASEGAYETADMVPGAEAGSGTEKSKGGEENGTEPAGTEPAESKQKLIYTCSMEIQTLTFSETAQKIREVIRQYGGIIESESTVDSNNDWYWDDGAKVRGTLSSHLIIRIPTDQYEDFLADIEGTGGKITNRSMDVQNITRVYNDQTVYIESLEKQEERLLQMMEQAGTIEEMITVEERLTEVQTQLNQARSRLAEMDTDVAYSTINLSLTEVVKYTDTTVKKTFFERTGKAFSESVSGFLEVMELLLDIFIYLLPYVTLFGVISAAVFFGTRKTRAEHRKAREEMKRQMEERAKYGFGGGRMPNGPQPNGPQMNGPQMNGPQMNGPQMSDPQMNGPQMNGPQMNGPQMNGPQVNGPQMNGPQVNGPQPDDSQVNGPQPDDRQAQSEASETGDSRGSFSGEAISGTHDPGQNPDGKQESEPKEMNGDASSEEAVPDEEPSLETDTQEEEEKNDIP